MAPTCCCPPHFPQCSTPPTLWHHGMLPKRQQQTCLCFWSGQLCLGQMGYLWSGTFAFIESVIKNVTLLLLQCMDASFLILTKLISNGGRFSWIRRLANTGWVGAADTEAIGFSLGEIKQCKSRRFNWDLCVHPLPAVCPWDTLRNKERHLLAKCLHITVLF